MDELIHHCLRELSFDGNFGCDVSRLQEFVTGFYAQNSAYPSQTVDETYCAFLWSVIVRYPTVLVGTTPPGAATEVYIAPQLSAKRKVVKGESEADGKAQDAVSTLDIIEDARSRSLEELRREYGDTLRIAVDPKTSFAAITGSHIRSSKLSDMVYTALQLVTRGREKGISVVDLGKKSGYDQKTCFYLVKQLLDMDLVVKVRRGGVGSHLCIHKYFYERSPMWQQIRNEEMKAESTGSILHGEGELLEGAEQESVITSSFKFEPMDARHLSSLPLLRARVVKLLKASKNQMHESNNIMLKLGFVNPTKTDRRFFRTRIRELIHQEVIEQVLVPNKRKKDPNAMIKCIRLVSSEVNVTDYQGVVVLPSLAYDDEKDDEGVLGAPGDIKTSATIHKQVTDLLNDADTDGMTLNGISDALRGLDKRIVELVLSRAEKNPAPSHLRDLAVVGLMESHGRERRNRYFTLASYHKLIGQQKIEDPVDSHANLDLTDVGGFARFDPDVFYETEQTLFNYQDKFKDQEKNKIAKPRKHPPKNPILPDGTIKLGRPRKHPLPGPENDFHTRTAIARTTDSKHARDEEEAENGHPTRKKKRLDPPSKADAVAPTPKRRGRPPKKKHAPEVPSIADSAVTPAVTSALAISAHTRVVPANCTEIMEDIPMLSMEPLGIGDASFSSQKRPRSPNEVLRIMESIAIEPEQGAAAEVDVALDIRPTKLARVDGDSTGNFENTSGPQSNSVGSAQIDEPNGAVIHPPTSEQATEVSVPQSSRPKINVSHFRRENEFLRVIEGLGGIANLYSKEFLDAHLALILAMSQSGEPTSAPVGARIDKRTAAATIDNMETRGRIRRLKTSVAMPTGPSRPACVVYLPDVDEEKLYTFLGDLGRAIQNAPPTPIKRIDEVVEYGANRDQGRRRSVRAESGDLKGQRRKAKHRTKEEKLKAAAEAKALLRRKAAEAKSQRESDWGALINRVHPETLKGSVAVHIRRVRHRFMQSSTAKDESKWEKEITDAMREADIAASKVLKKKPSLSRTVLSKHPPPVTTNPPEKSVESLIASQRPFSATRADIKGKGKQRESEADTTEDIAGGSSPTRRHRFQWNRDLDELARDASAIIRARCRNGPRLDLAAFEQVFPFVPRNSVRQRLVHLRETPGNDAYMNRLEDKWYELWVQHRGTSHLPDEDPDHPSNFNLIIHVEFLRKHVDKNALRIGFIQHQERDGFKLPASVAELLNCHDVIDSHPNAPCWDFMWNATVEEGREKKLVLHAFPSNSSFVPTLPDPILDHICMAEAALKMVFGTPTGVYDSKKASRLLHEIGEEPVSIATKNLLNRGVLSKRIRDPKKSAPGRTLKISEVNQNLLGGPIPRDTFQEALALEDTSQQEDNDGWQEWSLVAGEGDVAALIDLVSDDKVEFRIDTSQAQAARPLLDWNSKKADDDQIETMIQILVSDMNDLEQPLASRDKTPLAQDLDIDSNGLQPHGRTMHGDIGCCKLSSARIVDCSACLEAESFHLLSKLSTEEQELTLRILEAVQTAGPRGFTMAELLASTDAPAIQVLELVRRIRDLPTPLVFWAGYSSAVLVHSAHLQKWTVIASEDPMERIFPRRWLDISGSRISDIWDSALKAIIGVILFRPGISETELLWRLKPMYDKQEVRDVLRYLHQERFMEHRSLPGTSLLIPSEMSLQEDRDEMSTFWFVGDARRWYEV